VPDSVTGREPTAFAGGEIFARSPPGLPCRPGTKGLECRCVDTTPKADNEEDHCWCCTGWTWLRRQSARRKYPREQDVVEETISECPALPVIVCPLHDGLATPLAKPDTISAQRRDTRYRFLGRRLARGRYFRPRACRPEPGPVRCSTRVWSSSCLAFRRLAGYLHTDTRGLGPGRQGRPGGDRARFRRSKRRWALCR